MIKHLRTFDQSEVAKERMKIIKFYDQYGEKATKEAFGVDRKVISRWKGRLNKGGNLTSLAPSSTRPKNVRRSVIPTEIINFIERLRHKRPRLGKEKIKPLLDTFCLKKNISTISESTVGNVIKSHKFFFYKKGRIYHNPASKCALRNEKRIKKIRAKHPPKVNDFGHIMSDTVERIVDGIKYYFYSAIDIKLKFALTLYYPKLNSQNNKDFYQRFLSVYPLKVLDWQTDNGLENLGKFDDQLIQDEIPHIYSYPNCPKINTYIERYNRTIQEEFIDCYEDIIHNRKLFSQELADYMIFYNTDRIHDSLENQSPLNYLLLKGALSQMSLTYTFS